MYLTKNSKSPFYQIIYEVDGKISTKSTKERLKSEALKFLSEFEKNLQHKKAEKKILIKDFMKEYETYISETKSKSYLRSVKLSFKQFVEFTGNILINDVNIRLVDSFLQNTFKRAQYSAGLYYRTLKAGFSAAVRWNYIKSNPFNKIKAPKTIKKNHLFISEVELQEILKNVLNPSIYNMIILSYDSGLRLSEVVNIQWNNVDLQQKLIKVSNSKDFQTKSKRDRVIPLTDRLYKLFLSIAPNVFVVKENYSFIFSPKHKSRFNEDYLSKSFKKAVRSAKLNEFYSFHGLRHSFATNLVQKGVSLYVVSKLLGHSSISTTQIYAHLQQEDLQSAIKLMEAGR